MPLAYYAKRPGARLDYGFDWSPWLGDSASIIDSTWTVPAGLTLDGPVVQGAGTSAWLSDGLAGHAYQVENTVETSDGRTDTRWLAIHVTTEHGFAPWAEPDDVRAVVAGIPADTDVDLAIAYASEILYDLSGRQFGLNFRTVRPVRRSGCGCGCSCGMWERSWCYWYDWSGFQPVGLDAFGGPWSCRVGCAGYCRDDGLGDALRLPGHPRAVSEVTIEGVVLDPEAYYLDPHGLIRRNDGLRWPCYQDITAAVGTAWTWTVTYLSGRPVPTAGKLAAAHLAGQLALGMADSNACRLPGRIGGLVSLNRQDVTMAFQNPAVSTVERGRTGLWEVDTWLASANPYRLRRPSGIYRADAHRGGCG